MDLYMSFPSFFQVRAMPFVPSLAMTHVHPAGHTGPLAGWSLPSNLASQTPPALPTDIVRPSLPFGVKVNVSGELVLRFLVFHFPASPGPPDNRSNVMESWEVPPSALTRLESMLSVLPSLESLIVPVAVTFPFVFSVTSHVFGSTSFQAMVMPHGVITSLPSVLKVYDWPSIVAFISPPDTDSYMTVVSPKLLFATFIFHVPA